MVPPSPNAGEMTMENDNPEAAEAADFDLQRLEAEAAEASAEEQAAIPDAGGDTLPDMPTADLLRPIIDLGCGVVVPAWGIQEQEKKALADAYAALVDKYMPDGGLGPYAVELNALLLTAAIVVPRLHLPKREEPEAVKEPEPVKEARQAARQATAATMPEAVSA